MTKTVYTGKQQWHSMQEEAVLQAVAANAEGLKQADVAQRLEQYGPNSLEVQAGDTLLIMVWRQINHPLIYLLLGAGLISILANHAVDALVIGGVVLLNTVLGVFQENKAGKAMASLRKMAAPHARVLRDGKAMEVAADEVVPGDILLIETGDRIAADARVIESTELRTDESALTGESEPVSKNTSVVADDSAIGDRRNMVWMSTAVTAGRGRAVVVATGMGTSLGSIAGQVQESGDDETPLQQKLAKLSTILGVAGCALSVMVFFLGILRGHELLEMVFYALATAVSAIPEGLPAVISVTLALGVQRMTGRNAIVRRLPAVETLGSTTVICTDKTGTLTRNEMTVTRLWTMDAACEVTGGGYAPEGEIRNDASVYTPETTPETLRMLLRIGLLNNNASLSQNEQGVWELSGTPTEGALSVAARKIGLSLENEEETAPRIAEIPFYSESKYMATLHEDTAASETVVYVKGASDRVLSRCSHIMVKGEAVPLGDAERSKVEKTLESYADQALRMVAGAYKTLPEKNDSLERDMGESGLTFVGFWGIVDPARSEVIEAIRAAQEAGIRIVMITGDHAVTASAIAREVGIAGGDGDAITGAQLDAMEEQTLIEQVRHVNVFARVSPEHKLRILKALKANGAIVAMTGDGVNDAPALKGADIGIAMGKGGTEVAREASDMVLADDNFATIVHAVEEGRVIFANLRRVVFFLMTTNLGEVITLALALMIGLPLPLTAIMILWINLVTDGVCTIPLGIEPKHWDVLKQPPRPPSEGVLDFITLRRMLILAPIIAVGTIGLFAWELKMGSEAHAQTVAFATLAAFQWFQALSARTIRVSTFSVGIFSNAWLWAGIMGAVIMQILVIHTAIGQKLFGVAALTLTDWLLVVLVASSIFVVDEIMKVTGFNGRQKIHAQEES